MKDGEVFTFNEDKSIKERDFFKDGKKNGETRVYKDNILVEKKTYKNNILDGSYEKYKDGKLFFSLPYKDGLPEGIAHFFSKSGIIQVMAWYKKGELNGPYILFDENGGIIQRQNYSENKLNGKSVVYNNSKTFEEGEYKNGLKEGLWVVYKKDGSKEKVSKFQEGILISEKVFE